MPCCCVVGCTEKPRKEIPGLRFYSFPGRPWELEARKRWIAAVKRTNHDGSPWEPTKSSFVCSKHFVDGIRSQNPNHPGFVPSIFPYRRNSSDKHVVLKGDILKSSSSPDDKEVVCSAPHCTNSQECGYRLFKFPWELKRRKAWFGTSGVEPSLDSSLRICEVARVDRIVSCTEGVNAEGSQDGKSHVCPVYLDGPQYTLKLTLSTSSVHFENDQFEYRKSRKDKYLKANAIPTIFYQKELSEEASPDHPASPCASVEDPRSTARVYSPIDLIETYSSEGSPHASSARSDSASPTPALEERSTSDLLEEIAHLKHQLKKMEQMLKTFLTDDQIEALANAHPEDEEEKSAWDSESITRGLKFQFNLGTHGYNFLRSTNYPLPAIETLNTRLGNTVISFGVFEELSELLQYKVQALDPLDRLCTISLNEMQFSDSKDLVKNKRHRITGSIRDHDTETVGNYITVVLIRGLRSCWEQVIACDTTAPATEGMPQRTLLEKSISFAEECGLRVLSFSSNLSANSRLLWSAFGVDVAKSETERITHFDFNDHEIHVIPDVCHILKSLKAAVDRGIHLSQSLVDSEALPSTHVSSKYVEELWNREVEKRPSSRLLHHLQGKDVEPGVSDQISLESAVQFFSVKTARALESAVMSKTISPDALSTAYFCRLVYRWFSICDSKALEDGITIDNKQTVFEFLRKFIKIFQGIKIDNGWSPINAEIIMSTMSLCEVVDILLQQDGFGVVLLHQFSQDAVEAVIFQMSDLSGSSPAAFSVQCLEALKTITINQLISDVDRSCYSIPSMNNRIEKCVKTSSTHVTTECKPKRIHSVFGSVNGSKTTKCLSKNGRIRSSKTPNASQTTESKPQKRKHEDINSKSSSGMPKCELRKRRQRSKKKL